MRLDEAPNRSLSPPQKYKNGSTRSPGSKASSAKLANGDAHLNGSYTNGNSKAKGAPLSADFHGHDREEVTRIIIQGLTGLGYHGAAGALCKESGYQLEGPTVAAFRRAVLEGDWAKAEELLFGTTNDGFEVTGGANKWSKSWSRTAQARAPARRSGGLTLSDGANREEMLFWMKQQKYLELLEQGDRGKALMVLRQELQPLRQDEPRVHTLASLMMCPSAEDLKAQAQWDGARGDSRQLLLSELSSSISPSIMIPENRLAQLLTQVKSNWIDNCLYHNTAMSPSLYTNHLCDWSDFPMKPVLELRNHENEVWYLKYSHDGTMLASASKDNTVVIYETTNYKVKFHLKEHEAGISHLAWSSDDTKLISCCTSRECSAKIWDVKTGLSTATIHDFTYPVTSATFTPDGKHVILGSQDTRYGLAMWDLHGNLAYRWTGDNLRTNDLALSPDGQRLVVMLEKRILVYAFPSKEKICEWASDGNELTSVSISQDSQHMLVSMQKEPIKLMEIDTGRLVETYAGHVQKTFIIRSSFGGANENFVVSGSENTKIYIWRSNGVLIDALEGHTGGCVNAVAWHPKEPRVFASAGDDFKVRIWKPVSPNESFSDSASR